MMRDKNTNTNTTARYPIKNNLMIIDWLDGHINDS